MSEVWFGDATEQDLQPNIDGLSRDEVLSIGMVPVVLAVVGTRLWARRHRRGVGGDGPTAQRGRPTPRIT